MTRTPRPVPRNRGGAAGPSIPPRGPDSTWGRNLLIALRSVLFTILVIILLIYIYTSIADASGPLQSVLPVIGAGPTGTYVTTTGCLGWLAVRHGCPRRTLS